jgi:hypothetical protein
VYAAKIGTSLEIYKETNGKIALLREIFLQKE